MTGATNIYCKITQADSAKITKQNKNKTKNLHSSPQLPDKYQSLTSA